VLLTNQFILATRNVFSIYYVVPYSIIVTCWHLLVRTDRGWMFLKQDDHWSENLENLEIRSWLVKCVLKSQWSHEVLRKLSCHGKWYKAIMAVSYFSPFTTFHGWSANEAEMCNLLLHCMLLCNQGESLWISYCPVCGHAAEDKRLCFAVIICTLMLCDVTLNDEASETDKCLKCKWQCMLFSMKCQVMHIQRDSSWFWCVMFILCDSIFCFIGTWPVTCRQVCCARFTFFNNTGTGICWVMLGRTPLKWLFLSK